MRRNIMRINEWFSSSPCKQFDTNESLFNGLQRLDNAAILCVQLKAMNAVRKLLRQYGLPPEQADDVLNQSTLIFLRKIADGTYQFQNHAPSTYLVEIARRVALMATRSQVKTYESVENHQHLHDPDVETYQKRDEATEMVGKLLGELGDPCQQIIRLHHIEGFSDEEVVNQQLTRYTTVNSLKMKRSDCMKKLIQLAQKWKTSTNT